MKFRHAHLTNVGKVREKNEDTILVDTEKNLYIIADGMGGHPAGGFASATAAKFARLDFAPKNIRRELPIALTSAAEAANRGVVDAAEQDSEKAGMGTTIALLGFTEDGTTACTANVGDSRIYLYRKKPALRNGISGLEQLTTDHTIFSEVMRRMSESGGEQYEPAGENRHVLSRAIGRWDNFKVDTRTEDVASGDIFLLCTDGLTGMVDDAGIESVLMAHSDNPDPDSIAQGLVDEALARGGDDNVSVIVVIAS